MMKVSHLFQNKSGESVSVSPEEPLIRAAELMVKHHIGSLVVYQDGKIISIVSERDVMRTVGQHGDKIANTKVADVMAKNLITCDIDDSINDAMDMMLNNATGSRIRHLPVLEDNEFIGVISMSDIVETLLAQTKLENNLLKNYIQNWPEEEK